GPWQGWNWISPLLIGGNTIALIEGDGVLSFFEIHLEAPAIVLIVVASGNHQVIRTGRQAGKRRFAIAVGKGYGSFLLLDCVEHRLAIGRVFRTRVSQGVLRSHARRNRSARFTDNGGHLFAQKDVRMRGERVGSSLRSRQSAENGQQSVAGERGQ